MKKNLLVYGAGAIGRGYVPWVYPPDRYRYHYVDANPEIRRLLSERKRFTTFKTVDGSYKALTVEIENCFNSGEEASIIPRMDAVITAVGPRNALSLKEFLVGSTMPVICFENDPSIPGLLALATGNPHVVFGIPDVITSNTGSGAQLANDPLSVITENGVCFVDEKVEALGGLCRYVTPEELRRQWLAKLYIHNTPHCIAAYLGSMLGVRYLHEAMKDPRVAAIVAGAMHEMRNVLELKHGLEREFVQWYADKELSRFSNVLLHDPVSRVAREPFRKLAPNERLIGAAELALSCGIVPHFISIGIMSAFYYENSSDPDFNIAYLRRALSPSDFLKVIIRITPESALFEFLSSRWERNLAILKELTQ